MQVKTAAKVGSFGEKGLTNVQSFSFTPEQPLIGIWGYDGPDSIGGIGVIKLDTTSKCLEDLEFR